jgi:UDP-3-O-[3-hydroxymyristoyl] glucosamine N-acyltransferase
MLERRRPALAICDAATAQQTTVPTIAVQRPRLGFVRVLQRFFAEPVQSGVHPTAIVDPKARIAGGVSIGAFARVGAGVSIGPDCVIGSGVALEGEVALGPRCLVKPNSVIGAPGFGFEREDDGTPIHFPHLGRVVLEAEVWIGSCSTIERATLGETRLCHGVKVDDLVQIGHNVLVGANSLIMANAVLCGGAVIGEGCWIAPNSAVRQRVRIGDRATVGLGAVVIQDVPPDTVVAGVPARPLPVK